MKLVLAALLLLGGAGCEPSSPPPSRPCPPRVPTAAEIDAAHSRHWLPRDGSDLDCIEAGTSGPARDPAALERGRANRLPDTEWKEVK